MADTKNNVDTPLNQGTQRFREQLLLLGYDDYETYLSSPHWNAIKAKWKASGRSMRCAVCNATRIQLHHHCYDNLGNESLDDFTPLCRPHHEEVHAWLKAKGWSVGGTKKAVEALAGLPVVRISSDDYKPNRKRKKKISSAKQSKRKSIPITSEAHEYLTLAAGFLSLDQDYKHLLSLCNQKTARQWRGRIRPQAVAEACDFLRVHLFGRELVSQFQGKLKALRQEQQDRDAVNCLRQYIRENIAVAKQIGVADCADQDLMDAKLAIIAELKKLNGVAFKTTLNAKPKAIHKPYRRSK